MLHSTSRFLLRTRGQRAFASAPAAKATVKPVPPKTSPPPAGGAPAGGAPAAAAPQAAAAAPLTGRLFPTQEYDQYGIPRPASIFQISSLLEKDSLVYQQHLSLSKIVGDKKMTSSEAKAFAEKDPRANRILDNIWHLNAGVARGVIADKAAPVTPVRVTVTGASGAIGYALLARIASGAVFGPSQPVILQLLELEVAMPALAGVVMELEDCAFPLLRGIVATSDPKQAFENANACFLVGAKPRGPGMERSDLLQANGKIFIEQGRVLNNVAADDVRVLVVGNPANTNAWIAANSAPDIPKKRFMAMTKLDHNRGLAQLAEHTGAAVSNIENFAIWGNHSSTQFPDVSHTLVNGKPAQLEHDWVTGTFIPAVQQRGAAVIKARGASSAASAASAAAEHMKEWVQGTNGKWTSMAVHSAGEYGITAGLFYSYPVVVEKGEYRVVSGLSVSPFALEKMKATEAELKAEISAVQSMLN